MDPIMDVIDAAEVTAVEGPSGGCSDEDEKEEEMIEKAQKYMELITVSPDNPNPNYLHALASLLEFHEFRYMAETGHSSSENNRTSHSIGRLGNLIRENDDFFELISSKFLSESRYSMSLQAATARVLLSCSLTWMFPHVFEEDVLETIKNWVLDDGGMQQQFDAKPSDFDMRKTYATGLLAICLTSGSQVVEDVLTSGLSAKLMRYLRNRVLGETGNSQKDPCHFAESKNLSVGGGRGRDEGRARLRQHLDTTPIDDSRMSEVFLGDLKDEKVQDVYDADIDDDSRWHIRDLHNGRLKMTEKGPGKSVHDEGLDESSRDDTSRCRVNRGWMRSRVKTRVNENNIESELLLSPGSENRGGQGHSRMDSSLVRNVVEKRVTDNIKSGVTSGGIVMERDVSDDCFQDCRIGNKDISDFVKSAVRAAEAEARAANAPLEAVKAVGDAAAELVKSAAMDEFKSTSNVEAAVLAASKAASSVIDAGNAVDVSRDPTDGVSADLVKAEVTTPEGNVVVVEFSIPDIESLAQQREKFCIQCLEILGEYVEVLGPVLHEKGVDVCIALLVQHSNYQKESELGSILPDVLKLIFSLAAHRKFAAVFVDRGGIQMLLKVPRVLHTFSGLSSCFLTIGSLQGIMERVCALPSEIIKEVVQLGLQLLECQDEQARKNIAIFFAVAFVFRAVLDAFDSLDGVQKMLGLLQEAAAVRLGVSSGTLGPSASGTLRNDRPNGDALTTSEKQIAYHSCVALRQYFRAQLLLLVDTLRPNKSNRSAARHTLSIRAGYKPLDISNEAMDAVFIQIQKDRKLGPALVRAKCLAVDKFLTCNGHVTMLELCQAPPVDRYLHDLLQYALGILHVVTFVPYSRKSIVTATLSNNRVGIAVLLEAANGPGYLEPDIIQQALNVLINLVCPPPSISRSSLSQNVPGTEFKDKNSEKNLSDRAASVPNQSDSREKNGESNTTFANSMMQSPGSGVTSGLVGDRRISLGVRAGCAGLAAQLEQGYGQAREAVRANNGIKSLLQLLQTRLVISPASLDCLRALVCRVLLGLARDDTIAHILTKLQVGKKLSELIRDLGSQMPGSEQNRWQTELTQAAIELIAIVTNSGRTSTLVATDAAIPALRRIERAAIAAATPITYHSRELLLLIQEHLQACGLSSSASTLLKEAQLTPLPSLSLPSSVSHHATAQEPSSIQIQWPAERTPGGFLSRLNVIPRSEGLFSNHDLSDSVKRKALVFSPSFNSRIKARASTEFQTPVINKGHCSRKALPAPGSLETPLASTSEIAADTELTKTPVVLPLKRKSTDMKEGIPSSSSKRLNVADQGLKSPVFQTPTNGRRGSLLGDVPGYCTSNSVVKDIHSRQTPSAGQAENFEENHGADLPASSERLTLDSIVVQYLKHQHRQCPAPITTLPPLSLLHPHVCPEPQRSFDAPSNVTSRISTREFRSTYGGIYGSRKDRQFVYSRFRPWRTCRDDAAALLTCMTFLGDSSQIATGGHSGDLKIFDLNSNNILESCTSHQAPLTLVQSHQLDGTNLVLSSSSLDVKLWDASSISGGPIQSFEACKAARFSNTGTRFAALPTETTQREILLYDIQTHQLDQTFSDPSSSPSGRGHSYSHIHFSPLDTMLLWNGVLWDRRASGPVHRFDQFTDYGGGGFHPAGNEVIINSEVWDLRNFRLLRSVPSMDQTFITFNSTGDVIYAILRRNMDDIMTAVNTRRAKHPMFSAFRTLDAVNYSDIATIPVDRCVLDLAREPTDSFVGLITMDDQDEMFSSARIYEIGRRRPPDDDSDPDDGESEDEDEDDSDDEGDIGLDPILGPDLDGDSDADDMSNDDSVTDIDDDDDEQGEFFMDGLGALDGRIEIVGEGDEDDDDSDMLESFSSGDEDYL